MVLVRLPNDAVIAQYAGTDRLCRAIWVTEEGRYVADISGDCGIVRCEPSIGEWPKCGVFVEVMKERPRNWLQRLLCEQPQYEAAWEYRPTAFIENIHV